MATAISGCDPEMSDNNAATWQRADWLNRLSVANKQDFARLHGFRFMLITIQVCYNLLMYRQSRVCAACFQAVCDYMSTTVRLQLSLPPTARREVGRRSG